MAATQFEFISLPAKAKQALDDIGHALSSSLLLLDDPFAVIIRQAYGIDAFYQTFQPINVLPLHIQPHSLTTVQSLHGQDSKQVADHGDGWDEWQWDEKSQSSAAEPLAPITSTSASSSNSATPLSPPITVLLSGAVTVELASHVASVVAAVRSSALFVSSQLFVYCALSSQSQEAAGLLSYAELHSRLPSPSSVHHLPLTYSTLLPSVFFVPSLSSHSFTGLTREAETAADALPSLSSLVKGRVADADKKTKLYSSGLRSSHTKADSSVSSISAALTSLLTHLHLQPDVFSSGRLGHGVALTLTDALARRSHSNSAGGATKRAKAARSSSDSHPEQHKPWQTASVVLVDRMHDMASACSHSTHVLDHMYYTQRRVDEEAATVPSTGTLYSAVNALHHSEDKDCNMLLGALVNETLPAALRIASRLLVSSSTAQASKGKRKGDVSVTQLAEQMKQMEGDMGSMCTHYGLYQLTKALVRAEADEVVGAADDGAGSIGDQWRQLQSLERVCLSSLPSTDSTSADSLLATLMDLLQSPPTAARRSLPLLPLLSLSCFVFSALGDLPLSASHEQHFRDALLHRVKTEQARDETVARLVGSGADAESFVDRSLTLLQQMRYARATFSSSQLSNITVSDDGEPRVEPFVARLLSLCLDPAQSAADLEHHHSAELSTFEQLRVGAKDTLRAAPFNVQHSLSSFLSRGSSVVNKVTSSLSSSMAGAAAGASHPSRHTTLIFVVLGDMSWLEVSSMLRVAALYPACNVLIGCTGIADAEEMAWKTFGPSVAAAVAAADVR